MTLVPPVFLFPWALAALALLPGLWWLLRLMPPPARRVRFPPARLLAGLVSPTTPARTPPWLLALRLAIATLLILGLAAPVLGTPGTLQGAGPVLLVVDDGWAAATDWQARLRALEAVLDEADRAGRPVALLATAPDPAGQPPRLGPVLPAWQVREQLAGLRPLPWPPDRRAASAALDQSHQRGAVVYASDGLAGPDDAAFDAALARIGPVRTLLPDTSRLGALLPPRPEADSLVIRLGIVPGEARILTATASGPRGAVARASIPVDTGAATAEAAVILPTELRNSLVRLTLDGPPTAGGTLLLDEASRRHPVGLIGADAGGDTPFTGPLFYVRRALAPYAELRDGDVATLLRRPLSVLVAPDRVFSGPEAETVDAWVRQGGLLLRFAGPRVAESGGADPLLPVTLLDSTRQTGGALSWSQPAHLAPFPPNTPFAGLPIPQEVTVGTQVLAEPGAHPAGHTWAALTDGTPLVTEQARGRGRIVLFHVSADADWSALPLSGVFVDMLRRLVALSSGKQAAGETALPPTETLDGFGTLGRPPPAATALAADAFGTTPVSPAHPPGLYGPEADRHALNLGAALAPLAAAAPVPGAETVPLGATAPMLALGPFLIAAATALLAADLLASLALRGLVRPGVGRSSLAALAALVMLAPAARAASFDAALTPRLAYIRTGDAATDDVAKAGLDGLSAFVNRRTSATLAPADAVTPGQDDLSLYPLLYWPITPDAPPPSPEALTALNGFTAHGGILLIDTRDGLATGGSVGAALAGLAVPPLAPLAPRHVLAHAFYLLTDFPGRYDGPPVWVERGGERDNDDVSPVILGANDWAAAWATDASGRNPYPVVPGGARQRLLAYRFGVNLVMYALTGNYKGDQVHIPALLERFGQ